MRFLSPLVRALGTSAVTVGLLAGSAPAQSLTNGALRGVVVYTTDGTPITGVQVTVEGADGRAIRFLETDAAGTFSIALLPPGTYRVLAEQVGLQPVRLVGVVVAAGQTSVVTLRLERRPPPVTRVVELPAASASGGATLGRTVSGRLLAGGDRHRSVTDLSRDVTEVVRPGDAREGWAVSSGGLPASASRLWVDGLAETLLRHPGAAAEPASAPLFQRDALAQAMVQGIGLDAEWRGHPGATLAGHTARGSNLLSFRPYAAGSSAALAADVNDNPADSSAVSFQAGAALAGPIVKDTAHFALRFDYQQLRIPSPWPWESDAGTLSGAAVSLRETIQAIAENGYGTDAAAAVLPVVRTWKGFSGLGRVDWRLARHDVMVRFGYADWTEESPLLQEERSNLAGVELQASDLSGALSVTSAWDRVANEFRLGLTTAKRDWRSAGLPATVLAHEGVAFGSSGALPGRFETKGLDLSNALQLSTGAHRLKLGLSYTMLDYEQDYRFGSAGLFTFGSLDGLAAGEGTFFQSVAPAQDLATPRLTTGAFFFQDTWSASPELSLILGIRYDRQSLPDDQIRLNQAWQSLTGQRNDAVPDDTKGWGPRVGFVWDVQSRGEWLVRGGVGLYASGMDPALFAEAALHDGGVTVRRGLGSLAAWPAPPGGAQVVDAGPRLTLFSDTFRNPRAFKTGLGITRAFRDGVQLHLSGAYHHTDFLPVRVDLNRSPVPSGETQEGRLLFGTLVQQDGLVTAAPGSNRRFADFDLVSGLAPTGFADYYEAGIRLERQAERGVSFALGYTYSRTTDNVLGQRSLDPADQLHPFPEGSDAADWAEGRSDFDVPHRVAASLEFRGGGNTPVSLGARWRYRSGLPYTPGFRPGVDVNGDGSGGNDPAWLGGSVPGVSEALARAGCTAAAGDFAERNSCREEAVHALDLRAGIGLPLLAADGSRLSLVVDAFNLVSSTVGLVDRALVLIDPDGQLTVDGQGRVTLPLKANPNFGQLFSRRNDPRLFRIGLRMEY